MPQRKIAPMPRFPLLAAVLTVYAMPGFLWSQPVPDGSEFQVNETSQGSQRKPEVAMSNDGTFVVTWRGQDADQVGVFAQHFAADGSAIGGETVIADLESGEAQRRGARR